MYSTKQHNLTQLLQINDGHVVTGNIAVEWRAEQNYHAEVIIARSVDHTTATSICC